MMQNTQSAAPSVQVPELGRLKAATERVVSVNANIQGLLSRFFGPGPDQSDAATSENAPCYRNDMSQLFEAITELERLTGALANIG